MTGKPPNPDSPSTPAFDDVRMRGFKSRRRVEEVTTWIDSFCSPLSSTTVGLSEASGRILASDVISPVDVPKFRRAMMDGFALQAKDTLGSSTYNPLTLKIVGAVLPGQSFEGEIQPHQAVQIMTGAPLPSGADAVLPAERATANGEVLSVFDEVAPGKHVGRVGEDIGRGTTVLPIGRRLRPQDLGILSSIGKPVVEVVRKPAVRLLITGDELSPAGSIASAHQTVDANSPMLAALVERDGGELLFDGILPDEPDVIQAAMSDASADVVLVSGGSSVGQEDHAPRILAELGELAIHGVAMRPSSPTGMGRIGDRFVFLLPGNPVSCLCAYDFFAGRAIRQLAGLSSEWPYRSMRGTLERKISSVVGRQDYARVLVSGCDVDPIAIAGASVLSSTSRAHGFVVVPTDSEGYPPGAEVEVFLYD